MADLLLRIKEINNSGYNYTNDDWVSTTWDILTNGVVQTKIQRTLSGEMPSTIGSISENEFNKLKIELSQFEYKLPKERVNGKEATAYEFTVFDGNNIKYNYIGYISKSEYLLNIIRLASKH